MRAAVVGHVEWARFAQVERVPAQGEIVTATETWEEPAGGGAVAAGELVRLGAEVDFFVAVGNDAASQTWSTRVMRRSSIIPSPVNTLIQPRSHSYGGLPGSWLGVGTPVLMCTLIPRNPGMLRDALPETGPCDGPRT